MNFVEIEMLLEGAQWKDEINDYKLEQGKFWLRNREKMF